jgi:hypothetical protein
VRAAALGYAGLDDEIKIREAELDKLHSFDEALVRYVDKFDESLNTLEQAVNSRTGIENAIAALDKLAIEANEAFSLREDVLTNLGKTL